MCTALANIEKLLVCRELQVDGGFDVSANPQQTPARAVATAQQLGSQEPPVWKDDSWRTNNRYKTQGTFPFKCRVMRALRSDTKYV